MTREHAQALPDTGGREFQLAGHRCWLLPENGWARCWPGSPAPPACGACRSTLSSTRPPSRSATADGPARRHQRPRTVAEQAIVDDDIDSYLANAGLPPRPRRYTWYLLLPGRTSAARLLKAINTEENALGKRSTAAADIHAAMETVTSRMLGH